jgi:hypothetical protein
MNIGIDLMVFCLNDDDFGKEDLGIEVPIEDCSLRLFTFYNIDYISVDRSNLNYTTIGSSGDDFTCNERYEVVKHKLEQLRILRCN